MSDERPAAAQESQEPSKMTLDSIEHEADLIRIRLREINSMECQLLNEKTALHRRRNELAANARDRAEAMVTA